MGKKWIVLANLLTILGVVIFIFPFWPALLSEINYYWHTFSPEADRSISTPVSSDFQILIPKLAVSSIVIPNTDPFQPDIYLPVLKQGVAHALHTALPGEVGRVYLFAHSTDVPWRINQYNAQFYLLHKLIPGDPIQIDYQGKRYAYEVVEKQIVSNQEVNFLEQPQDESHLLTLQTCWPPGTTWKRLLVTAKQI